MSEFRRYDVSPKAQRRGRLIGLSRDEIADLAKRSTITSTYPPFNRRTRDVYFKIENEVVTDLMCGPSSTLVRCFDLLGLCRDDMTNFENLVQADDLMETISALTASAKYTR